jgi:hypothetical protein
MPADMWYNIITVKDRNPKGNVINMTNINLFNLLLNEYHKFSASKFYIIGFISDGVVYEMTMTEQNIGTVLKLDKASRGAGYSIRFRPTQKQKKDLAKFATPLCSEKFFEEQLTNSKYNKGEIFEKLITEKNGQTWEKDSVPFWVKGDININGIEYQIKYDGATFINEKGLAKLRKMG